MHTFGRPSILPVFPPPPLPGFDGKGRVVGWVGLAHPMGRGGGPSLVAHRRTSRSTPLSTTVRWGGWDGCPAGPGAEVPLEPGGEAEQRRVAVGRGEERHPEGEPVPRPQGRRTHRPLAILGHPAHRVVTWKADRGHDRVVWEPSRSACAMKHPSVLYRGHGCR